MLYFNYVFIIVYLYIIYLNKIHPNLKYFDKYNIKLIIDINKLNHLEKRVNKLTIIIHQRNVYV